MAESNEQTGTGAGPSAIGSGSSTVPVPKGENTITQANDLLLRGLELSRWNNIYESWIGPEWMEAYSRIADRCDRERRYGIYRYPYEASSTMVALAGGFFDHPYWPLLKGLEKHGPMRAVAYHES